jgi:cyclophilin family peptidyl-prolyl cis-trans isomerase
MVEMRTSLGTMKVELYPDKAPKTAENFLQYAREGFYDGTVFHRVISGFMIQGGGFTPDMSEKETRAPIENEASNGLKNVRGSLAMARTGDPHSASSQFFINTVDNPFLDFQDESVRGWGYAVFGKVVEGLETLDAIKKVSTRSRDGQDDVPLDPVVIESVRILN